MTAPGHFKAECPYCGQHVEIPEQLAGDWITCPDEDCGKSFPPRVKEKPGTLPTGFAPKVVSETQPWPPQPSRPKLIEENLELLGDVLLALCVVGAIVAGVILLVDMADGDANGSLITLAIVAAIAFLLQGWIIRTFFHALAEIIRQLRKLNSK